MKKLYITIDSLYYILNNSNICKIVHYINIILYHEKAQFINHVYYIYK